MKYDVEQEPIVLSKQLLDALLKQSQPANLLSLYCFYYYTAKWQGTNQPRATIKYVAAGMGWGIDKVKAVRKRLKELGLIEDISTKDINGKIRGHYVKVNLSTTSGILPLVAKHPPKCFNTNNINASSDDSDEFFPNELIEPISFNGTITKSMFDKFWQLYPRKNSKGKAYKKWCELCNIRLKKDRPTWRVIEAAIVAQMKSDLWQDSKYIPFAATWLNQHRWIDDPKEMHRYVKTNNNKPPFIRDSIGGRYDLCPDGEYRHCRTGDIYIP